MKRLNFGFTKKLKQFAAVGILATSLIGANLVFSQQPNAAAAPSFGGPFDSDPNAVLWGGASNVSTVQKDYKTGDGHNSAASIQHIYNYFKINTADINGLGTSAVAGSVTKSGDVLVGGKVVATGARTAGRQITASSKACSIKRTVDGTTFYGRAPSCSFENSTLTAFVVMQNGQFKFAILSSCGNPVNATPKAQPKPAPTVTGMLACVNLLATPATTPESNGDLVYTFTAKASATNASISSFTFNFDGNDESPIRTSKTEVTTGSKTFAPGTHTVTVTVAGAVKNGNTTIVKAVKCSTTFTVKQPQAAGALTCDSLTPDAGSTDASGNVTHVFTIQATATNNATITDYLIDFGNGTKQPITTNASKVDSQTVTFATGKSYTVVATVNGKDANGNKLTAGGPNSNCKVTISPTGIVTTAVVTTTTPSQPLPNTGAGGVIGLFAGASLAGFFGYRFFLNRRLSRQ